MSDPLSVLGLGPDTSPTELEIAWRRLAMAHHPDRGGDPEFFAKLAEARKTALSHMREAKCERCRGSGQVNINRGFHGIMVKCPGGCLGTGKKWPDLK